MKDIQKKRRYTYTGAVMYFDRVVVNNWKGTTYAVSAEKAKANLAYQYKREARLAATAKVSLPGRVNVA